jgi:hypothetical protein
VSLRTTGDSRAARVAAVTSPAHPKSEARGPMAAAMGPAGKLMGAQKNDAVSWLPGGAESTKVI